MTRAQLEGLALLVGLLAVAAVVLGLTAPAIQRPLFVLGIAVSAGAALRLWRLNLQPSDEKFRGSLSRRMIGIAGAWILLLLALGGVALDRVLTQAITQNFDDQLEYVLTAMIASAETDDVGEVRLNRPLGDQRFLEPGSGLYWQISAPGHESFRSRSLWDQALRVGGTHRDDNAHFYESDEMKSGRLRIVERDIKLPLAPTIWRFQVAQSREGLDEQIATLRKTVLRSFALLGLGLIVMAALQTLYGLWP